MRFNYVSALFLLMLLISSCAAKFSVLNSDSLGYGKPSDAGDSIQVSVSADAQAQSNNRRYAEHEKKQHVRSFGLRITNSGEKPVVITTSNFSILSPSGKSIGIVTPEDYATKVRQGGGWYMLHTLWSPWAFSYQEDPNTGKTHFHFIIIPVGLIVGIGNAMRASNANLANFKTHKDGQIWNRQIAPHSSITGLITLMTDGNEGLVFKFDKEDQSTRPTAIVLDGPYRAPLDKTKNETRDYQIVLKDVTKPVNVTAKIDIDTKPNTIAISEHGKKRTVTPSETKWLSTEIEGRRIFAVPSDSCWLFRNIAGKITIYYYQPEINPHSISHLQNTDGPIVPFTPQALKDMIGNDAETDLLIFNQKYLKAIYIYNSRKN